MIRLCKQSIRYRKGRGVMKNPSGLQPADECLCQKAQEGDRSAEGMLVSRYLRYIQKLAYQYRGILDFEDLVQEGCIGLLNAIGGFDPARDTEFRPFAFICIRNRMFTAMRRAAGRAETVPLDDGLVELSPGPEQQFLGQEELKRVLDDLERIISPMEKRIFFAYLGGFDYQTIADTLHISQKSVDNALQRVRKKLKTIDSE